MQRGSNRHLEFAESHGKLQRGVVLEDPVQPAPDRAQLACVAGRDARRFQKLGELLVAEFAGRLV